MKYLKIFGLILVLALACGCGKLHWGDQGGEVGSYNLYIKFVDQTTMNTLTNGTCRLTDSTHSYSYPVSSIQIDGRALVTVYYKPVADDLTVNWTVSGCGTGVIENGQLAVEPDPLLPSTYNAIAYCKCLQQP